MKIEISKDNFGTLCVCALRYCHGRRTYMPSLVQGIVRNHLKDLDSRSLQVILNDEEYQQRFDMWGDDCDKRSWERFYEDVRKFRQEHK